MDVSFTPSSVTIKGPVSAFIAGEDIRKVAITSTPVNSVDKNTQHNFVVIVTTKQDQVVDIPLSAGVGSQKTWTNDQDGATIARNMFLAIAGVTGSNIVADGNYGDVTVSGGGAIWTINPGVVTAAMMDSGAAPLGDVPTADGLGGVVYAPQAGGSGTVVGPGVTTIGNVPRWANALGTLLDNGLGTSLGGLGVADSGKLVLFNAQGQIIGSSTGASVNAVTGTAAGSNSAGVNGVGNGAANAFGVKGEAANGFGVHGYSPGAGVGVWGWSIGNTGGWFMTNAAAEPALHALALGGFDIAHFEDGGITPALIVNPNGGLAWRDASAAQATVDDLPAFGALTKGVVPAAGAVPSAAKFLTETGTFAVPPLTTTVETVSRSITQAAHGFAVGDLVKYTGAVYAKAQADVEANAEVVGIVSSVAGVNDFTLTTHGYVTGLSGLTSGTTYFLSEITAGLLTATAPSTTLNVRKAQFIALSTTTGHYNNFVGYIIP